MAANGGEIQVKISVDASGVMTVTQQTVEDLKKIGAEADRTSSKMESLGGGFNQLAGAIKGYFALQTVQKIAAMSEEFTNLQARVRLLSGSVEEGSTRFRELMNIAGETGSSMKDTVGLWSALTASLKSAGATNKDVNDLVMTLQKIGTIGGSSAEEMSNALRQFQQSIASGKIQAEEFNSILEQMPELARQIAAGMGIPYDELRGLMLSGKLTIDQVMEALVNQQGEVNKKFDEMPRKVSAASNSLINEIGNAVAIIDQKIGASKYFAKLLDETTLSIQIAEGTAAPLKQKSAELEELNKQLAVAEQANAATAKASIFNIGSNQLEVNSIKAKIAAKQKEIDAIKKANEAEEKKGVGPDGKKAYLTQLDINANNKAADAIVAKGQKMVDKLKAQRAELMSKKDKTDPTKYAAALASINAQIADEEKKGTKHTKTATESIEDKLKKMEATAAITADTTQELERQKAIQEAINSLGDKANATQKARAAAAAGKTFDMSHGLSNAKRDADLRKQAEKAANQYIASSAVATGVDPAALIKAESAAKLAALKDYYDKGVLAEDLYQQAVRALRAESDQEQAQALEKRKEEELSNYQSMAASASEGFGALSDALAASVGKSSGAYQAAFALQKSFAIASATAAVMVAAAKAMETGLTPAGQAAAYASVFASGMSLVSQIASLTFKGGKAAGGPVSGSSMYRVGEGNKPEIYKANNGNQYMIPGQGGRVISNSDLGGGGMNQNITFNIQTTGGIDDETMARMAVMMKQISVNTIKDQQRPGGQLARSR